jgi:molecular chaperone GrpE
MTEMKKNMKKKSKDKTAELTELLKRTQADFENYKKQVEKRVEDMHSMASKDIIIQLLPLLGNFELALKNTKNTNHEDFVNGVQLIHEQFNKLMNENGVEVIKTNKQQFDPHLHEALMKVPSDVDENIVVEEFQKGYTLSGKVIQHAKVKVSAGKIKEEKIIQTEESK